MRRKSIILLLIIAIISTMTLASCAKQEAQKPAENKPAKIEGPIKIGAILSLSGPGSPIGIPERNALDMIVEQINKEGGIEGAKVEVIIEDDETNPAKATQAARKLIQQDQVVALIGSSVSPCSLAIKEVVDSEKVPLLCLSAANAITADRFEWIFRMPPRDAVAVEKVLTYLKEKGTFKKVAILHDSNAFGQSGADELSRRAPEFGIEIVGVEKYETNAPDLTSQLTKLKAKNPDALIVWGTNPGPAIAAKNMKQIGFNVPYFGSHGIANKKFIELAGDAAEGVIFPAGKVILPESIPAGDPQKALVDKFIADYKAKYNENPNTFAGHAYDAMLMLKKVIPVAGLDRAKIRDELEKLSNFVGIDGVFNYSPTNHDGLTISDMVMIKIESGAWTEAK